MRIRGEKEAKRKANDQKEADKVREERWYPVQNRANTSLSHSSPGCDLSCDPCRPWCTSQRAQRLAEEEDVRERARRGLEAIQRRNGEIAQKHDPKVRCWAGLVTPLRFVCGQSRALDALIDRC